MIQNLGQIKPLSTKTSQTVGYYAAFVALGLASASLGPTLPGLAEHTQTQLSGISFLFTARSLGYLLVALLGGRLYDQFDGHKVVGAALGGMVILMSLIPVMSLLWMLTLLLLLLGLVEGMVDVGGNTLLVWVHRSNVGPFMNALHFFFGVGAFLAPVIVAQALLLSQDITWAYWILALLMAPVALNMLRLPSPTIRQASNNNSTQTARTNYRLVALVATFLLLYVGAEVSFGGWIFTYTTTLELAGAATAAYLTSAFWGALTLGRLFSIPLAARFRPRIILISDLLGCLLSVALILLWPRSLLAVWLGTLGLGVSMASIFPVTITLAERRMSITGRVTGWFFTGASLGAMLVPWLIGQLFESMGAQITMVIIGLDLLLAVTVFIILITHAERIQLISDDNA